MKFTIDPELKKIIPRPTKEDYETLYNSIKKHGQKIRIVVDKKFDVKDGFTRLEICEKLGIEPKYEIRNFASREEEIKFIIQANYPRRHLNDYQKVSMNYELYLKEKEKAKKRMGGHKNYSSKDELGPTSKKIGEFLGVKKSTVERSVYLIENADEKTKINLLAGTTTPVAEAERLQLKKRLEEIRSKYTHYLVLHDYATKREIKRVNFKSKKPGKIMKRILKNMCEVQ